MVFALDKSYSEEEEEQQKKTEQYQGGVRAVARTPKNIKWSSALRRRKFHKSECIFDILKKTKKVHSLFCRHISWFVSSMDAFKDILHFTKSALHVYMLGGTP